MIKNITMDEALKYIETKGDYILLDVRHDDEFKHGHINGAINYDNDLIDESIKNVLPDLNKTIFVYCRSGARSKVASLKLNLLGYTNIIEIGGILDYKKKLVK